MKLKDIDYKILFELMKNSKISDRRIAKKLGVSQPTITRRRVGLENEVIDGYTTIPRWEKIEYTIMAITLVKAKTDIGTKERYVAVRERAGKWLNGRKNVIMAGGCRGLNVNSFMISFHKTYDEYDRFMRNSRLEMGDFIENSQSIIINLAGEEIMKPLHLKYLTEE